MQASLTSLIAYVGAWVAAAAFVWVLFERADKVAKEDARDSASKFLRNLEVGKSLEDWPDQFCNAFDALFGKRYLSWKFLWRSSVASICAVILVTFLIFGPSITLLFERQSIAKSFLGMWIGYTLSVNLLTDYLSLLETRWIINKLKGQSSIIRPIVLLILDVIVTAFLFTIFLFISSSFGFTNLDLIIDPSINTIFPGFYPFFGWMTLKHFFNPELFPNNPFYVFLYSTFLTSVWVWLYVLSSTAVVGLSKLQTPWLWLRDNFLDIESKPILAMGWIASMIVLVLCLVSIPFVI